MRRIDQSYQGRNQLFILGEGIFIKFHSLTSSCLFNRGTNFSQTVTGKLLFATFPKMRTFRFYQNADRTIGTEKKISSLIQTLDSVLN